jgi:TPR repeat protein
LEQNTINALDYYEKACEVKYALACHTIGEILEVDWFSVDLEISAKEDEELSKRDKISKQYYKKACDLKLQKGCDDYKK